MLKIKVDIPEEYALTAIARYLAEVGRITDVQTFRAAIRSYVFEYGCSELNIHAEVYGTQRGEARQLCNKYYNQ